MTFIDKWLISICFLMLASCAHVPVDHGKAVLLTQSINSRLYIDEEQLLGDFKQLSSPEFQGRKYLSEGNVKAQQYIVNQLNQAKITPFNQQFSHKFTYKRGLEFYQGTNIIAVKKGVTNQYIVLTAHFDHIGKFKGEMHLGADDNASGTAALLHIAKGLEQVATKHNIVYLFTDAEEENLIGANAFAQQYPDIMSKTLLNINLDMLAGYKYTKKLFYLPFKVDELANYKWHSRLKEHGDNYGIIIRKGPRSYSKFRGQKKKTNWRKASDHGVFYQHKIPFLYFGVGVHKNYHTSDDTFENTNHRFFVAAVYTIFEQIHDLEQQI